MIHVSIFGSNGRMGKIIETELAQDSQAKLLYKFDSTNSESFFSESNLLGSKSVLIDFSVHELFPRIITRCCDLKIPYVGGVTGLGDNDFKMMDQASQKIPILWAPNMSLGVQVMVNLLSHLQVPSGYDIAIEDIHHKKKLDAPSGTALRLKEVIESGGKNRVLQTVSLRVGHVPGTHSVMILGVGEELIIQHRALDRSIFAKGAIAAAKWLASKPPGRYTMADVLT